MVDLHSHIVPAIDDGSKNMQESIKMIDTIVLDSDLESTIVFTPHFSASMNPRVVNSRINRAYQFQDIVEEKYQYKLNFLVAGELMLDTYSLKCAEITRYPGTGWLLVEFNPGVSWIQTQIHLKRIIHQGFLPLIAHPERYRWCRRNPKKLIKLSKMGCGILVSARSLRFKKYAKTARAILKEGLTHAICSDAHSPRDFFLNKELREKYDTISNIPWRLVTDELPSMILNDMQLPALPLLTKNYLN